jgi:hypothetical protein
MRIGVLLSCLIYTTSASILARDVTNDNNCNRYNADDYLYHNRPNNTAHLIVNRATGNAVTDAAVTVRKIWDVIPVFIQR